jgi:EmrB/QacA subfamily drug resistance transporter
MGALDQFVVLTALPKILPELAADQTTGTLVITAYIISSTVAVPIFAKLSDLYSRRNVFLGGLIVFIAGSIAAGLSQNIGELILFRAVQGFGSGDFFPVGIAIVAVSFPPELRARITGFLSGVFGIAIVAGPFLGSEIVDHISWRWVFYVNIPIGILGLVILATTLGALRPAKPAKLDAPGIALLVGWVGALMYALIQVSAQSDAWAWTDPRTIGLLVTSVILAAIFAVWELRSPDPLVPLKLLRRRIVAACGGTTFLIGMVLFPLATFLTLLVGTVILQNGPSAADTVRDLLYALVIPLVIGAGLGGNLLTRISYRPLVVFGVAVSAIGMFFLTKFTSTTPFWVLSYGFLPTGGMVLPLIPIGFGIGITFPVFLIAVQNQVPTEEVGAAGGLVQFLQQLGGSIGLTILSSYEATRATALAPTPPVGCSPALPSPTCLPYFAAVQSSAVSAFDSVFVAMLGLLVVAFVFSLFITGRLQKGPVPLESSAPVEPVPAT